MVLVRDGSTGVFGLRSYNPLVQVEVEIEPSPLTQMEYETLRDAMPTMRDQLVCRVLRGTGWRIGEVLACQVRHMAFNGPEVALYLSLSKLRTPDLQ